MLLTTLLITDSYGRGIPLGVRKFEHTQDIRL